MFGTSHMEGIIERTVLGLAAIGVLTVFMLMLRAIMYVWECMTMSNIVSGGGLLVIAFALGSVYKETKGILNTDKGDAKCS